MNAALQAIPQIASPPDSRALRTALGQFATGITVVTTRAADCAFVGLTVNSFSALSLEPALILWSLRGSSPSLPVFENAERFVVNVLAEAQVETSRRFALPLADKFDGVAHAENAWGQPLIHGAAAWFECRTVSRQIAGDHCLFIAAVERFTLSDAAPLLFHAGGYFALGSRL
ncbi:MAG: flavin reductase family protein [Polaromonas sp.]|uniref:flavin reductase family protein n=1 Tax=Polaromonas sp. TaxID=1869339 RepID=UPI002732ECAD|nr:flavin reductase family protein [Polaromonas sp.]MDP2816990.1 flavin reductase family protein [Polaromonas sp.]